MQMREWTLNPAKSVLGGVSSCIPAGRQIHLRSCVSVPFCSPVFIGMSSKKVCLWALIGVSQGEDKIANGSCLGDG